MAWGSLTLTSQGRGTGKIYLKDSAHAESVCPWPFIPSQRDSVDIPGTQPHPEMFPGSVKDTVTTDEEDNEIYADDHA